MLKQVDDEWYYGKNKRGCEGIFPISYINVIIPLEPKSDGKSCEIGSSAVANDNGSYTVKAMYDFNAETADDLTIMVGFYYFFAPPF